MGNLGRMLRGAIVLLLAAPSDAYLNIFISQEEVMKLMGLSAELFYVNEGVVNKYAMGFVVPVPAHIQDLVFSWQSLAKHPLPYTLAVEYDNQEAMGPPQVNISSKGLIPTRVQSFRVRFPCTGRESAEVRVQLLLNVTSVSRLHNDTALDFRRNKICLQEAAGEAAWPRNASVRLPAESFVTQSGSFYVAVGCACAMLVVVAAVAALVYVNSKKARAHHSMHTTYTSAAYGSTPNVFIRLDSLRRDGSVGSGSYATIASFQKLPSPYATTLLAPHHANPPPLSQSACPQGDVAERVRALAVPPGAVELQELLYEGTFGRVFRGVLHRGDCSTDVLVKTVSDQASRHQAGLLLREGTMLSGATHHSVLPTLAVVLGGPQPLVAYPWAAKGNLKRFLQDCRAGAHEPPLRTQDLVHMAIQVVLALMYLHAQRLCHKDVAARNCVVDERLRVRVGDTALSRDLFAADYHCLGDNENRPLRWMALEALQLRRFSPAADVWSFGVLLWELATLAQQPYAEVDPFEMEAYLRDGYRLAQPLNCPDELFGVMACCWLAAPEERPAPVQLLTCLQDFYTALNRFI